MTIAVVRFAVVRVLFIAAAWSASLAWAEDAPPVPPAPPVVPAPAPAPPAPPAPSPAPTPGVAIIELTSAANPVTAGQAVTLTATLKAAQADAAAKPTGAVSFMEGATKLGEAALANGVAMLTTPALAAGAHVITAAYGGDAAFIALTSPALNLQVTALAVTVTAKSAANPSPYGKPVALTVAIAVAAAGGPVPTGEITILDGSATIGAQPLDKGTASFSTPVLGAGNHEITVRYAGDTLHAAAVSVPLVQAVSQAKTKAVVAATPSPASFGQPVALAVAVSVVAPSDGAPAGPVAFMDGATKLGEANLADGKAALTVPLFEVGAHAITVVYPGDANLAGSTAAAVRVQVAKAATEAALSASPAPSSFGQELKLTAKLAVVAPGAGAPTGAVRFLDGATLLGNVKLDGGSASLVLANLGAGERALTAVYSGDPQFSASTSPVLKQQINQAATTTALTAAANPAIFGQGVELKAKVAIVAPGAATLRGTVSFKDGATVLGNARLSGDTATLISAGLAIGDHALTAEFNGDANIAGSVSPPVAEGIKPAATTIGIKPTANPARFDQPVSFTATVAVTAPGAGKPTGTVSFRDGNQTIGMGTLSGGTALFTTAILAVGPHAISAVYSGDASFTGSTSAAVAQRIEQPSTTTLRASASPSWFGQSVVFTAEVATGAAGAATGTVTFKDGATVLATVTLEAATAVHAASLGVGEHLITAVYSGDERFVTSAASPLGQRVSQAATATAVESSANPAPFATPLTLVATVRVLPPGGGKPTGTVNFLDGTNQLGTAWLVDGRASLTTSSLGVGSHGITAVYAGDANYTPAAVGFFAQAISERDTAGK